MSIALAVPEELGELDCLVTESEEEAAAVEAVRVGVEGEGGAAVHFPNKEGRPPVEGEDCKEDTGAPTLSLTKCRGPTIPYATIC
jgi:hypothetical protein